MLPFYLQTDESFVFEHTAETEQWESGFNVEDTNDKIIHAQLIIEGLKGKLIDQ